MTDTTLAALVRRYRSAAHADAALGITRQAFSAALKRGHLSTASALRAAVLLNTDASEALRANAAPTLVTPAIDAAKHLPAQLDITSCHTTNYAFSTGIKKTTNAANATIIQPNVHSITSQKQQEALDLVRWVFAVAGLRADSPRFNWYVSRWQVPFKIARAKREGNFDELVSRCPPIDPAWLRFAAAALDEAERYNQLYQINLTAPPVSGKETHIARGKPYRHR